MNFFVRNKAKEIISNHDEKNEIRAIGNLFQYINTGNLLSNASVLRAIDAISNAISSMKINEYRIINGEKQEIDTNLEYLLNVSPNEYTSASLFKKNLINNVFKTGNSLIRIERTLNNDIISLTLLDSSLLSITYNSSIGIPTYYYKGEPLDMTDYLLIYFYPDNTYNGYFGLSLQKYANEVLKKVKTVENFETNYFNGSAISGILSPVNPDRPVPREQAEKAKIDFLNAASTNGIVVMDKQLQFSKVSTNAKDNALIELQSFNVNQIARILNIPACYLFDGSSITEQDQITFFTQTISPLCTIIENELKRKLFFKKDWNKRTIEFDYESLIKSDRVSLASYYSQLFNLGVISPNEICKKLNLPTSTLEGTDSRYILQNAQPIDINLNAVKAGLITE